MMRLARGAVLGVVSFLVLSGCGLVARLNPPQQPTQELSIGFFCNGCVRDESGSGLAIPIGEAPLEFLFFPVPLPASDAVCEWRVGDAPQKSQPCSHPYGYTFSLPGEYLVTLRVGDHRASLLVVVRDPMPQRTTVTASSPLAVCEQTAPRRVQIGEQGLVLGSCFAKRNLEYIYYRGVVGECLLWNAGEEEKLVVRVPAGRAWSFSYRVQGVATGSCPIRGEVIVVSGVERVDLLLISTIAVF